MAYVRWDIILDWKGSEITENRLSKNEHLKPYAYGSGARGISKKIKNGDILWILTIPAYGSFSSFPSLVAMLKVEDVIDQENEKDKDKLALIPGYIKKRWDPKEKKGWKYVIFGNKDDSHYFPINNACDLLVKKILKDKSAAIEQRISGEHYGYIAQHFQTIRRIPEYLNKDLLSFKEKIHRSDSIFISYKRWRSGKVIKTLAESLLKKGINCWLDINRMPQKISRQYSDKAKQYFTNEIENAIHESTIFLAIKSDDYFKSEWTNLEYKMAQKGKASMELKVIETDRSSLQDETQVSNLVKQIVSANVQKR